MLFHEGITICALILLPIVAKKIDIFHMTLDCEMLNKIDLDISGAGVRECLPMPLKN